MITAQDEVYHQCDSPDPLWRESHYFNFYDPRCQIGAITTIGHKPNQGHSEAVLVLYLPGGTLLVHKREAPASNEIDVGTLRYETTEPLAGWRLTFDGTALGVTEPRRLASRWTQFKALFRRRRVRLDLRWQSLNPVFDYADHVAEIPDNRVAARHYEQTGRYTGWLEIAGQRFKIDALGQRDHSWGIRDWHAPDQWRWFTAQFGPDFAVHGSRLVIGEQQGELGFVWRDGANHVVERLDIDTEYEADGVTQRRVNLRLHEADGRATEVTAAVITPAAIAFRDRAGLTIITEALSRFSCGDRVGYGITEYLRQVR
ncbi:MAG: hypothetical protein KKA73_27810 [Chloroflexi bacterium]|nr:hypothetical protein [Chloroflexota bacterium]MBU1751503.1 hypothetical protein [Chloroflexota bacterium]MBU1878370.1 hypothetical protein [Chloroflexota bacterium]